jgi:hypothetical protein
VRNPKAGPAAYLLLRGGGNSEDATSPAGSASFLRVSALPSGANVCTLGAMMRAGLRVPNEDVVALAKMVDEPSRTILDNALERETVVLALTIDDRERILRALDDPQTDALAELRGVLLTEHELRRREGLVWARSYPWPVVPIADEEFQSLLDQVPRPASTHG